MEEVDILSPTKLRVILKQGIKRQIRLMLYDCGYEVENLRRVRIGSIWIDKLRAGMWRMLSPKDVADLKAGRSPKRRELRNPDAIRSDSSDADDRASTRPSNRPSRARSTPNREREPRPGAAPRRSGQRRTPRRDA